MKRDIDRIGIAGALAALALTMGCGSDDATGPEMTRGGSPAASIEVIPASVRLEVGESYWLTARLRDAEGRIIQDTRPIHWTSSDPGVALVSDGMARALVTAREIGTATIKAVYGGLSSSARLSARAPDAPPSTDGRHEPEAER